MGQRVTLRSAYFVRWTWPLVGGLLPLLVGQTAPAPTSAPATAAAPPAATLPVFDEPARERLDGLAALVEGPHAPDVRRTGARELLALPWPEVRERVAAILAGNNAAAQSALAEVLAATPAQLAPEYIGPLVGLLASSDGGLRDAAGSALAVYSAADVVPRLRIILSAEDTPRATRLGVLATLGRFAQRDALDAIASALGAADPAVASAALSALEQATATDFQGDIKAAQGWWDQTRQLPETQWQALQLRRLAQRDRANQLRIGTLEQRLVRVLEGNFTRAKDNERVGLLKDYINDATSAIRLLGLDLVQRHLSAGKPVESLPADLVASVRTLLTSPTPREQEAAIRAVTFFRDPNDAPRLIGLFQNSRYRSVRLAAVNGLGYLGNGPATTALLAGLSEADTDLTTEIVAALGRLAERGALDDGGRTAVINALAQLFAHAKREQVALRERILWAMGNLADQRFAATFSAALNPAEAVAVRQAALRGLSVLNLPQTCDALIPAVSDPDPVIRRGAIELLAKLGASNDHLEALWSRLTAPSEPEETVREAAWRAALAMLERRTVADRDAWLARLSGEGAGSAARRIDLLRSIARTLEADGPNAGAQLGQVEARLAAEQVRLGQVDDALATYQRALPRLCAAHSDRVTSVAAEILRLALASEKYDPPIAMLLRSGDCAVDTTTLLRTIEDGLTQRLEADDIEGAERLLAALRRDPPADWTPDALERLAALGGQLEAARAAAVPSSATTQPTTQPTGTG